MGMCTKLSQGFSEMEKNVLREKLDLTQVKKSQEESVTSPTK